MSACLPVALPLHQLAAGQVGRISQLVGTVEYVRRMHELGLRDGCEVQMVQPGNPCIVHVHGTRLCFRGADALRVLVTIGEGT